MQKFKIYSENGIRMSFINTDPALATASAMRQGFSLFIVAVEPDHIEVVVDTRDLVSVTPVVQPKDSDMFNSDNMTLLHPVRKPNAMLRMTLHHADADNFEIHQALTSDIHIIYTGDGAMQLVSHRAILYRWYHNKSIDSDAIFELPEKLFASSHALLDADPDSLEHAKDLLHKIELAKANIAKAKRDIVFSEARADCDALIQSLIVKQNSVNHAVSRLKQQPSFEATKRRLLIEKAKALIVERFGDDAFNQLEREAQEESLKLVSGDPESEIELALKAVESHPLHEKLIDFFAQSRPKNQIMLPCSRCGNLAKLTSTPTAKKRLHSVSCSHCSNNSQSATRGSKAVTNWNKDNHTSAFKYVDIKGLVARKVQPSDLQSHIKSLKRYCGLYAHYLGCLQRHTDHDRSTEIKKKKGLIKYLEDSIDWGEFVMSMN